MTPPTVFIGLDTETTGLHADADILELGMIAYTAELDEIATFSSLILPDDLHAAYRAAMDQARLMHHTSGLWDELTDAVADDRADALRVDRVEHAAIRWVRAHTGDGPVFLLGSTIGYDRGVLARHMPGLLACFHHQSVDATSIHLIARHLYGTPQADTAHHSAHRCLSDIRDSAALITRSTAAIIATQCPGTHPAPTADKAQV